MVQIITRHGYRPTADAPMRHGAYQHAIEAGYGTEADISDCSGALIASTGIAGDRDIRLPDLLDMMDGLNLPLALHVHSPGLAHALHIELHRHAPSPWFAFGMNPYDMATYVTIGLPVYTSIGAVNDEVPFYDEAAGVWLDPAEHPWTEPRHLAAFLQDGKNLCVIDTAPPGPASHQAWALLRDISIRDHPGLILCTSEPAEAANYFASS
jgi:hypothetical protein